MQLGARVSVPGQDDVDLASGRRIRLPGAVIRHVSNPTSCSARRPPGGIRGKPEERRETRSEAPVLPVFDFQAPSLPPPPGRVCVVCLGILLREARGRGGVTAKMGRETTTPPEFQAFSPRPASEACMSGSGAAAPLSKLTAVLQQRRHRGSAELRSETACRATASGAPFSQNAALVSNRFHRLQASRRGGVRAAEGSIPHRTQRTKTTSKETSYRLLNKS